MDVFTVDFETFYDKEYTLSKISTEDYIYDPRFEIILVGLKTNNGNPKWASFKTEPEYADWLTMHGVHRGAMLGHNTMFDGLITQKIGVAPKIYLDTLCMAQACLKHKQRSISLANCLKTLQCGVQKGAEVHRMFGRSLGSLSREELQRYANYCMTDCEGAYRIFMKLLHEIPKQELQIIDATLRMYLEPEFELDADILQGVLTEERARKEELMARVANTVDKKVLASNPQFAKLLVSLGVEPPLKISPITNKTTFAFSKSDPEWKELEDAYADDVIIGPILAARLGVKSTLAETRAERLLAIALKYPKFRVPLRYYAAHTGRYGGTQKINCQNFTKIKPTNPSRNQLRYAIRAPKGHKVIAADLSQIEVRLNAWMCACIPLMKVFNERRDPYCEFGSKLFGRQITKADEKDRFIAKTCILGLGYGMGHKKLRATLRKDNIKVSVGEALRYVDTYRTTYYQIRNMWSYCSSAIDIIGRGGQQTLGPCVASYQTIKLPNGMELKYTNLRYIKNTKYDGWVYDFAGRTRTLWGGKIVENIIQSLARITVMEHMLEIQRLYGYACKLQAHDELVYVIPDAEVALAEKCITQVMTKPPSFATMPPLPIAVEINHGQTYGDAK